MEADYGSGSFTGESIHVSETPARGSSQAGLLFWNRLGDASQVTDSAIGPDAIYKGGGRFGAGVFGGAFFAGAQEDARIQVPKQGAINGSAGTIEFWGRLDGFPATIGSDYRPFFILDETEDRDDFSAAIGFGENNGIGGGGLVGRVSGHGTASGEFGYWEYDDILPDGGENWHHYALVWDADGVDAIAGDRQVALFVDGKLASAQWDTYLPLDLHTTPVDDTLLSLLYNSGADGVAAMDNLKIWDHAKTDFSDRFVEGFTRVGTPGADLLTGSEAGDDLRGLGGADRIVGRAGDDLLLGGCGSDVLCGGTDDDMLGGGRGDDRLMGGAGADVLCDGTGRDWLSGGSGSDVFRLALDSRKDQIVDFDHTDKIDLTSWKVGYEDLQIRDAGHGDVCISGAGDRLLVHGVGLQAGDLDPGRFIFARPSVLFEDHFDGPTPSPAWESRLASQWIEDGWLHTRDTDGGARDSLAIVHDGDRSWTDYTVSLKADFVANSEWRNFTLVLRSDGFVRSSAGGGGSGYQVVFDGAEFGADAGVSLWRSEGADVWTTPLARVPLALPDDPMGIVLSVEGNRIRAWVDGDQVFDVTDQHPLTHGGFGVHGIWESESRFDDVVITEGGPDLLL